MKQLQNIKIEKIGYGGIGLARMPDGKKILIKGGALPGSIVDLKIVKQKKDYIEAHILRIHEHDPKLVDGKVFCPHFFSIIENKETSDNSTLNTQNLKLPRKVGCGGCKWQMLSYSTQLKLKHDIVLDAFKKLASENIEILPIIGSPKKKGYRNKIEFSFGKYITNMTIPTEFIANEVKQSRLLRASQGHNEGSKEKQLNILSDRSLGFHKQGEFSKIVDIDTCALISDKANQVFARIKELCKHSGLPVHDQKTHQGILRHLVIREGWHTGQLLVNLAIADQNMDANQIKQWNQLLKDLQSDEGLKNQVTTFVITHNNGLADIINANDATTKILWGDGHIYEKLVFDDVEISFRISPFSFFQTNTLGAEQLFSLAMKMIGQVKGNILDIYCGTGSIGLSFLQAGKGDNLIGIEISEEAIADAGHNAKINGLEKRVLFVANPAEKALMANDELKAQIQDIGLIILDPPREGLHKNVIAFLNELRKQQVFKLLYISCNPITMVRDIELLLAGGFTAQTIQPVDMFPQTHHIECIGVLK